MVVADLGHERLDFRVGPPLPGALPEDQVGPHAAAREVAHAVVVFRAVGVGVEMARPVVADVFEELHQPEGRLDVGRSEAEVLIVAAGHLVVQIDVKQLPRFPRLRDRVEKVQPRHLFVRHFRVHAHHVGMVERRDEAEIRAGRRHVDVAARLVGLGLERELEAVLPIDRILAEEVDRVAQPLDRFVRRAAGVGFRALASAPQHENAGAKLRAEIHRPHRLLQREGAHAGVVRGERAVAKHRIEEQVDGGHRHDEAMRPAGLLELADDVVAFGGGGIDRHEVVVVQVHAPGARLGQQRDRIVRRQRLAHRVAEGISTAIADRPQSERELVLGPRCVKVRRHVEPCIARAARDKCACTPCTVRS